MAADFETEVRRIGSHHAAKRGGAKLVRASDGHVLLDQLSLATTFLRRLRGLQLLPRLDPAHGLLLCPCPSLHTCFMRFPIDVVMLDRNGTVLDIRRNIPPWRIVLCPPKTRAIIETAPGALDLPPGEAVRVLET